MIFWKKLDEILLKNYQRYYSLISSSINFCCLLNNKNEYYKVIIGFNNKESLSNFSLNLSPGL